MRARYFAMVGGMMLATTTVLALPGMFKEFQTNYKPVKNSKLAKADCAVCHVDKKKTKLNPYGEDLKKVLEEAKTKKLTAEIFKKVEDLDSDKDEAKNIDEIKADTLPGDAKSKPAKSN